MRYNILDCITEPFVVEKLSEEAFQSRKEKVIKIDRKNR